MTTGRSIAAGLILLFAGASNAAAQDVSNADRLQQLLAGEFDNVRQMQDELVAEVPEAERHGWINRSLMPIAAPAVGENVLLGSVKYGPLPWYYDEFEFIIWTLTDQPDGSVLMHPRRFANSEELKHLDRQPEKLVPFDADDLVPAISGAACDIVWRPDENGFKGLSEPCRVRSTFSGRMKDWVWHFRIAPEAMYVRFWGTDVESGEIAATPEEYFRLERIDQRAEYVAGRHILFNSRDRADYDKALMLLRSAVTKEPDNPAAHLMLAYGLAQKAKFEDARAHLAIAEANRSQLSRQDGLWLDAVQARASRDNARDVAAWEKVLAAFPEDRWAAYELAVAHYRGENWAAGLAAVERALALEPDARQWRGSILTYMHSLTLSRLGRHEEAIAAAEPGLAFPGTRRAVAFRKGIAQIASGSVSDPEKGLRDYKSAVRDEGDLSEARYLANAAALLFEAGALSTALDYAQQAHALDDGFFPSLVLAYMLAESGEGEQALGVLEQPLTTGPDNLYLLAAQGWSLYRLGRFDEAAATLRRAQAIAPHAHSAVAHHLPIVERALKDPAAKPAARLSFLRE